MYNEKQPTKRKQTKNQNTNPGITNYSERIESKQECRSF